jgi:hypothetical protein
MAKKRTTSGVARPTIATGAGGSKLQNEKEAELSAIWGSERMGGRNSDRRAPQRKRRRGKGEGSDDDDNDDNESVISNLSIDSAGQAKASASKAADKAAAAKKKKDETKTKRLAAKAQVKLHCFVDPGTSKNDVREVFEQYEPKVALKVTQKGNLLNKSHYCVLTFTNKAMALHAVKTLDGSNQRDTIGVNPLKLSMMLSRAQSKLLSRRKKNRRGGGGGAKLAGKHAA